MQLLEIIKAIILGIIQGITEWLPVSSTGHMILFDSFWPMDPTAYRGGQKFIDLFLVVIQFGSILAVIALYRHRLNPFSKRKTPQQKKSTWQLWLKVIIGTVPVGIFGLLLDDFLHEHLYNAQVVSIMLILYGVLFIVIENMHHRPRFRTPDEIDRKTSFKIGLFQCLSLIPGTSRSGSTILGASLLGCGRPAAAEFSFFLAIPTMLGASVWEIFKYFKSYGFGFSAMELTVLLVGMVVAFFVSLFAIRAMMRFVKKHSFKPFGWYRIALGALMIIFSLTHVLKVTA